MEDENLKISADKIIKKSKQWTLEGDCTLLQWLDQISKNLEERAIKTSFELQNLSIMLDRTLVALSNATNNLAALQYSQFVENRVHDDDETLANVAEVPNPVSDVTDKAENPNMYSFLKKNLEMMNSCHEAYSISYDDSDDDDDEEQATNVVYRPRNPYEARALPHIYGSTLWKDKWHIGLCDSDNDFSGDDVSEQFSESSSTADESYESTAPTMSEWDSTAWGLNTQHLVETKEVHAFHNDGESLQGETYSQSDVSTPRTQRNVPIVQPVQEQRYYQHVPRKEENTFDDIFTESQRPVIPSVAEAAPPQKKLPQDNFISNEPPPDVPEAENQSNQRVGAKKPLNLFDDDEFSSLMDQIAQVAASKNVRVVGAPAPEEAPPEPKKVVVPNLFDDNDDIFSPSVTEPSMESRRKLSEKLEDDIFMPPPLPTVAEKTTKTRNLFDDDDEDDEFEKIFAATRAESNKFTQKTTNLFENILEDEQPQSTGLVPDGGSASVSTKVQAKAPMKEAPLIRKGLFDDDDDDNEEDQVARKSTAKTDLFEDVFSKSQETSKFKDSNNDLFRDMEPAGVRKEKSNEVKAQETREVVCGSSSSYVKAATAKTDLFADLFRDEPPEDVFANSVVKIKSKVADIFAEDFADDFEEFIPKSKPEKVKEGPSEKEKPATPAESPAPSIPASPEKVKESPQPVVAVNSQEEEITKREDSMSDMGAVGYANSLYTLESSKISVEESIPSSSSSRAMEPSEIPEDQAVAAVSSYTSLFSDEPPSDDDDPSGSTKFHGNKNIGTFSTINLFTDVPPDDDFSVTSSVETKRIHSIFYDDFNETIEASREMRAPSTYIFNDEPPPDDDQPSPKAVPEEKSKAAEEAKDKPKASKAVPEEKPKAVEEAKDKPKVSKLKKMDLQINVAALLPTAKLPSFKKTESSSESPSPTDKDVPSMVPVMATVPIVPTVPDAQPQEKRDLPENILPNLNRDRAKLQVKRRPSTRKGRQESYRKSLIEDETASQQGQGESEKGGADSVMKKSTTLFADDCVSLFAVESAKSTDPGHDFDSFENSNVVNPIVAEITSREEMFKTTTSLRRIPERTSIFENSEAEMEKELPNMSSKVDILSVESTSSKLPSVFEDSDPENIFETFPSIKSKPLESRVNKLDSLFDGGSANDNVSISPSLPSKQPPSEIPPESLSKPQTHTSLFDESDSAEEKPPTKTATKSSDKAAKPSAKPTSLFDESDDGSDDLFKASTVSKKPVAQIKTAEKKPKQKPIAQPVKPPPSSSLFSSDEENLSGDDIFGKRKAKVAPKKLDTAKGKPSASLFDDLSDDDDDLFGTSKKKPTGAEKSKTKPPSVAPQQTKTSAPGQQKTANSNNPLSDLLGP